MLDESTDVDGKSQLILYLRLRIDGVFVTKFWRIIEMTAQLTERAYKHWASVAKRCIARSHPGVSKKKEGLSQIDPVGRLAQQ